MGATAEYPAEEKSLRDEFAMAALTGLCANPEFAHDDSTSAMTAELAFKLAHAMLAERDKVKP